MTKRRPRLNTLPRRRSADALSLQSPRHRQRVIPDKRRAALDRELKETARKFGPALTRLAGGPARHFTRKQCEEFLDRDLRAASELKP